MLSPNATVTVDLDNPVNKRALARHGAIGQYITVSRRDWVDVDEFSGTDPQRIIQAVQRAASEGKIVKFNEGRDWTFPGGSGGIIDLTSYLSGTQRQVRLEMGTARCIVTGAGFGSGAPVAFKASGTAAAFTDLTTGVAVGDATVTLPTGQAAAQGWARGQWIAVECLTVVYGTYGYAREIKQILGVAGDVLTVDSPFLYAHATGAAKGRYQKITFCRAPKIVGGEWEWTDPATNVGRPIYLDKCIDVDIENYRVSDGGGSIALVECVRGSVQGYIDKLYHYGDTVGGDAANSAYGYGVYAAGRCRDLEINLVSYGCRHAFTTLSLERTPAQQGNVGGANDPNSGGNYFVGGPTQLKIQGQAHHDLLSTAPWDTHEFGDYIDFDVSASGGIAGLQVRARNVTGRARISGASNAGVTLTALSRDCDIEVNVTRSGGGGGGKGVAVNGTNNTIRGRIYDNLGPGVVLGGTNPRVKDCEIINNVNYGVQCSTGPAPTTPRVESCRIPKSTAQTVSVLDMGSDGVITDCEFLGYGGSSAGLTNINAAAKVKNVLADAGIMGNQSYNLGNPTVAPGADTTFFRGGFQLARSGGAIWADKGFRTSLTINTAGQTSAQIDTLWQSAVGTAAADGCMINDQTNFLILFRAGGKWYKTAALTQIA